MNKFNLVVRLNTDDDCPILYKGKQYWFYDEDLKISVSCKDLDEAVDVLICQIKVVDGYKASAWTRTWLDDCAKGLRQGETEFYIAGNQTYDVWLTNSQDSKLTANDYSI